MTKQFQVLLALKALVQAALPSAKVLGFDADADKPTKIGVDGCVIADPGDPGDPEVDLSPPAYNYLHRIPVDVAAANGAGGAPLDAMLETLGAAVAADRTLGGLCQYLDVSAPNRGSREGEAVSSVNWASFDFIADYSTSSPLA